MDRELSEKYERELDRLADEYAHYERQSKTVHRFAIVALVAPFVGYVWGWGAALVALLVSAALVGTRAYLIAMRKGEIRWNRQRLVADLEREQAPTVRRPSLRVSHA